MKNDETKISIYPYNHEANAICEFRNQLSDFEIFSLISCRGNKIDNLEKKEDILYTCDVKEALKSTDVLVLCDNVQRLNKKAYLKCLADAMDKKIKIYTSSYIYRWLGEDNFSNIEVRVLNSERAQKLCSSKKLMEINCPVLSVLGMGENCDKFSVTLSLRECLVNTGYKVTVVASNPLAKLFGCETIPSFMFDNKISLCEKIVGINHYVYEIVKTQKPDILLLSHAGGIMPLNEYEYNYFGEFSYIFSYAIPSDCGIFCTYFNKYYSKEYFDELANMCKSRLGIDIIGFYMSNQIYRTDEEQKKIDYHFLDLNFCKSKISSDLYNEKNILLPKQKNKFEEFVKVIEANLSSDVEII